jgi:CheY-like chemotaxis protein
LLDITRIINGKLAVRAEPCDAHSLIGLVVEMIRSDAQEKRIAIHLDLAARHSQITGDPARLQQVFWNLLRNAVKFSPEGGNVRIRSLDPPCIGDMEVESRVCIEVSDDGVGFEADAATVIFQPFEQGASGHRFGGLGLGLAIARAIVDIHGGTVRAKSPGPGQGATFTVELPGATRPLAAATRLSGGENPGRGSGLERDAPMRLLLVEDHEPTMQVLTRLLTRAGHHTVAAQSLAEARAAAAKETFDAVISDLGLPDGTGVELMQNLKAAHGLRGIALSGYGTDEDLRRSEAAGFVVHLVKPVDFNDLRRALREFVRARP